MPVLLSLFLPGTVKKGVGKFKLGLHVLSTPGIPEYINRRIVELHSFSKATHSDHPLLAWKQTKEALLLELSHLSCKLAKFHRSTGTQQQADRLHYGSAMRARLDPPEAGPTSVPICLRQVRAADLVLALKVNDTTTVTAMDDL